jgi:hypothetical protein
LDDYVVLYVLTPTRTPTCRSAYEIIIVIVGFVLSLDLLR